MRLKCFEVEVAFKHCGGFIGDVSLREDDTSC